MCFLASLLMNFLLLSDIGLCLRPSPASRGKESALLGDNYYHQQNKKNSNLLTEYKVDADGKNPNFPSGNAKKSHDQSVWGMFTFPLALSKSPSTVKLLKTKKSNHQLQKIPKTTEEWFKLHQKTKVTKKKPKSINMNWRLFKALEASKLLPKPTGLMRRLEKTEALRKRSTRAMKRLEGSQKAKTLDQRSQKTMKMNPFHINFGGEGPKKFRKRSARLEVQSPMTSQSAISQNRLSPSHFKPSRRFFKTKQPKKGIILASNSEASSCVLAPSKKSLSKFRHLVYYQNLNFVHFHLIPGSNVSFSAQDNVVENLKWVWTFNGVEGAREFLRWPVEFGVWSLGLLNVFTMQNMEIELMQIEGNCSNITVGDRSDDLVISNALNQLSQSLANFSTEFESKYGPSFFCYKRRVFVQPEALYLLCKNIMCPLDLLKYICCANTYIIKKLKRYVACGDSYRYDTLWWTVPSVVAVLVFASCPLLIMYISSKCSEMFDWKSTHTGRGRIVNVREQEIIYLDEKYPYTLLGTLLSPLFTLIKQIPQWTRLVRLFIPFCSLFIILLQNVLDYLYLYGFIIKSIDAGVFLGFRSIIAGFRKSSENFMPFFGGPYIALAIYLGLTCFSITVPKCLSTFLESGLQKYQFQDHTLTPLNLDLQSIEYFGSVSVSNTHGFQKIYTVYQGKLFMLINFKFWRYVLSIFINRWKSFIVCQFCWLMFPVYCFICILEILICIVLNLLPIVSFGFTIGWAYYSGLSNFLSDRGPRMLMPLVQQILNVVIIICVLYFLFIFSTICFDASLFVTRVCMFTYTGIIVYPKESYGFLIFVFTVVYYLIVCSHTFAIKYRKLLKTSIGACRRVQRSNDQPQLIVNNGENPGIHKPLFEHIVEMHCPKRKQAFISFYKLLMIFAILGISLNLMQKTDRFKQLDTLVHVGTALFTCALPTIFMNVCRAPDQKYKERALKKEIRNTISNYLGYFSVNCDESELLSD